MFAARALSLLQSAVLPATLFANGNSNADLRERKEAIAPFR